LTFLGSAVLSLLKKRNKASPDRMTNNRERPDQGIEETELLGTGTGRKAHHGPAELQRSREAGREDSAAEEA
jgi:hypothetical protein